jgi:hypothetical protein
MARAGVGWRLTARVWWALLVANVRYWPTVAPQVRRELREWQRVAAGVGDPRVRELALAKLREESFNAEVAATMATLTPRPHRALAVTAIVALQLLYDYLDGRSEAQAGAPGDPIVEGRRVYALMVGAVGGTAAGADMPSVVEGDAYAAALAAAVRQALARLPGWAALAPLAQRTARRCAEAQVRIHAVPVLGVGQAREWALEEAEAVGLGWRELHAGAASSILAVHALIAQAPEGLTLDQGERTVRAYLRICAVITLLDSLVDYEADLRAERRGFLALYEEPADLGPILGQLSDGATAETRSLHNGSHHVMTLVGAVAYWTTAPEASGRLDSRAVPHLRSRLQPMIAPAIPLVSAWRRGKRTWERPRRESHA